MKYHVITLGCQMNLSDSERVISVLDEAGYEWTDNEACSTGSGSNPAPLEEIHASLCHPGVTRLYHFVKTKNLAYSLEDVKKNMFSMYYLF